MERSETGNDDGSRNPLSVRNLVVDFLREADIEVVPVTERHGDLVIAAMERYGKGRYPAALNLGDCFAYAVATIADAPIHFIGDDFSRTDLVPARPA